MQRHPALGDGLRSAHLDAAQTPAALDPGALGAAPHRARQCPLHGPPERGPTLELLGYGLGDEARVELGDRKSTRLNSSHANISYAVFCLKTNSTAAGIAC